MIISRVAQEVAGDEEIGVAVVEAPAVAVCDAACVPETMIVEGKPNTGCTERGVTVAALFFCALSGHVGIRCGYEVTQHRRRQGGGCGSDNTAVRVAPSPWANSPDVFLNMFFPQYLYGSTTAMFTYHYYVLLRSICLF